MSSDGRGNPGRIILKNQPRLRLADIIRRRRTTLKALIQELGISTYAGLENWCHRMGVVPPTQTEFSAVMPPSQKVNAPQEGVVVLEAPPVISDLLGRPIDPDTTSSARKEVAIVQMPVAALEEGTEATQKKRRPKKESQPSEP